jgi:hypothetical protein
MGTFYDPYVDRPSQRWLPESFVTPSRLELSTGHHLRPIRESDTEIDFPAVMGSRERLWARYGVAWGWPPETMTFDQDREDLARHEREIAAQETFNYAVLNDDQTELLGCVYVDPPDAIHSDADAVVSWWVVDEHTGGLLELTLNEALPAWFRDTWGFRRVVVDPPPETAH